MTNLTSTHRPRMASKIEWLPFYAQMKVWDRVRQRDEAMQTHTSSLFSQHDIDDGRAEDDEQ